MERVLSPFKFSTALENKENWALSLLPNAAIVIAIIIAQDTVA